MSKDKRMQEIETAICHVFQEKYDIPRASFKLIRILNRKRMSQREILDYAIYKYNRYIETKEHNKHMGTMGNWLGIIKFLSKCKHEDWLEVTKKVCELYYAVPQKSVDKRFNY